MQASARPRSALPAREFRFHDRQPDVPDALAEVLAGLSRSRKTVAPKFFYDETGSRLFDAITELPEHYLTRTATGILQEYRDDLARMVGDNACLVEYGSGSSAKIRILLEACRPAAYVPVDISREHLLRSARTIYDDFDWLAVHPTCADYSRPFALPEVASKLPCVAFFPGSSIGNFDRADVPAFLAGVGEVVGAGGRLIVGVDAKKDVDVLHAAYNDGDGVTGAFNLNLLRHLNALLDADFDLGKFEHQAEYNAARGRIEMYLASTATQSVRLNGAEFAIEAGERIHTESSYKYHPEEFLDLAAQAGFVEQSIWSDDRGYFMVLLLEYTGGRAPG